MKIRKIISLILVSVMTLGLLVGCGNDASTTSGEGVSLVGEKIVSAEEAKKTVVFTVEEEEVTLDEMYLYYIQYLFNNKVAPEAMNEAKKADLDSKVVSQMMVETVEYLLALQMEELEISEEDLEQSKVSADNFYNFFGKEMLANYGVDKDTVDELFRKQVYVTAVTNKAIRDLSESNLEQYEAEYKDLKFHSITYALFPSVEYDEEGKAVTDEEGKNVALSDQAMKEQLAKAKELQKKAASGEKTMEELIEEYGISHCSGVERNYEGAYVEELNEVVKSLEEGDVSAVIQTDAGYMIARMDKKNDQEYKDYMISYAAQQMAKSLLPKMQEKWSQQAGLDKVVVDEEVVADINAKAICNEMKMKGLY
nr:peptidyl-prolyl cis-trans isomerase [Lachnospiraceae bacterium]